MVEVADRIELHPLHHCPNCAKDLSDIAGDIVGKRQLFDLPPVKIQVTEHQIESKQWPCCQQIKGKPKKNKPRKLAELLDLYEHQVLYFIWNFDIPFDNNQSERDLRMAKVKQKVSGSFRSPEGAAFFARIRSYVLTAQKQGYYAYDALRVLFQQNFSLCHSLVRG